MTADSKGSPSPEVGEALDPEDPLAKVLAKLTPLQVTLLDELPSTNFRLWSAAKRLSISSHTVHKWLRQADFKAARDLLMQRHLDAAGASHERVLLELARVAFSDPRDLYVGGNILRPDQWDDDIAASVQAIDFEERREGKGESADLIDVTKIRLHSKLEALKILATLHGKLIERIEHSGPNGGPIQVTEFEKRRRLAFLIDKALRAAKNTPPEASGNAPQTTL